MSLKFNSRTSMTLMELMVSVAIMGILMLAVVQMFILSDRQQQGEMVRDALRAQTEAALSLMVEEFQSITEECINPPLIAASPPKNQTSIVYRKVIRVAEDPLYPGNYVRTYSGDFYSLEWRMVPDELDDGLDNNGNGVADEGMVVLRNYTKNQDLRVMVNNVVENYQGTGPSIPGFCISFDVDDPANPAKWLIRVSLVLEKVNPAGIIEQGATHRSSTIVYYKTATIALAK